MKRYTFSEIQRMEANQTPSPAAYYDAAEVEGFCRMLVDAEKHNLITLLDEAMRVARVVLKRRKP